MNGKTVYCVTRMMRRGKTAKCAISYTRIYVHFVARMRMASRNLPTGWMEQGSMLGNRLGLCTSGARRKTRINGQYGGEPPGQALAAQSS